MSRVNWNKARCDQIGAKYIESSGYCSIPDNMLDKILIMNAWGFDVERLEHDKDGNEKWVNRLSFGNNPAWAFVTDGRHMTRVEVPSNTFDKWMDKYPKAIKKMELNFIDYLERPEKVGIYFRERKLNNWNKKWAVED